MTQYLHTVSHNSNVDEIFVSGKSHIWHKIQESEVFQSLKGCLLERKMIRVQGSIFGHCYLKGNNMDGFLLASASLNSPGTKEEHGHVWLLGPWDSFPYNSTGIKVRLWPKLITWISHFQNEHEHSLYQEELQYHTLMSYDTTKDTHHTVKKRIVVKRGCQLTSIWSFKANHFCTLKFRNGKKFQQNYIYKHCYPIDQ